MAAMKREGKTLKVLKVGDKRRLADGRNAWRKMSDEQRAEFLAWIITTGYVDLVPSDLEYMTARDLHNMLTGRKEGRQ